MAKPKQRILVEENPHGLMIWTDEPEKDRTEIASIEGIQSALTANGNPIFIYVDPRYNLQDIAQEIRDLLMAEVPDVFKKNA